MASPTEPSLRLETPRLILDERAPADCQALFDWCMASQVEEQSAWPLDDAGRERLRVYFMRLVVGPDDHPLSIRLKATDELIGQIRFFEMNPRNQSCSVGYMLAPAAMGHGYCREALERLLRYLFTERDPHLQRVVAQTAATNLRSQRVLTSQGFVQTGIMREHFVFEDGRRIDNLHFELLRPEWQKQNAGGL